MFEADCTDNAEFNILEDLLRLKIIDSLDDESLTDYLLLWLLLHDGSDNNDNDNTEEDVTEKEENDADYIDAGGVISIGEYRALGDKLRANGFVILREVREYDVVYLTVKSKKGKIYRFKIDIEGYFDKDNVFECSADDCCEIILNETDDTDS